jgi:hypothetical protein
LCVGADCDARIIGTSQSPCGAIGQGGIRHTCFSARRFT